MTTLEDRLTLLSLRLDGLAREREARIMRAIGEALKPALGQSGQSVTLRDLQRLRQLATRLRLTLPTQIANLLQETLPIVAELELRLLLPEASTDQKLTLVARILAPPFKGRSWTDWAGTIGTDVADGLAVLARTSPDAGALSKGLTTILKKASNAAHAAVTTAFADIATRARLSTKPPMVRYSAVLDDRTSAVCRGLDGTLWRPDDPELPRPPRHPNCRSMLVPISEAELEAIRADEREAAAQALARGEAPDAGVNSSFNVTLLARQSAPELLKRNTPEVPRYEQWLSRQSVEIQKEVLGPTRWRAWKAGLPLSRMATYSRALTIDELKRLYPAEVG